MSKNPSAAVSADTRTGTGSTNSRRCRTMMASSDQCSAIAPSHSALRSRKIGLACTGEPCGGGANAVLRKSDRNSSPSSARRPTTPMRVDGLSTRLAAMPATEGCWPVVVGIRKGSGVPAQIQTRHARPPMHTADEA